METNSIVLLLFYRFHSSYVCIIFLLLNYFTSRILVYLIKTKQHITHTVGKVESNKAKTKKTRGRKQL